MNCLEFDKIVTELADYQPMLSTTRDAGVSHAAWCADCARKLTDVRAVSAGLLLAAGAEVETAPSTVKANLMAAFREQTARAEVANNVVEITDARKLRWPLKVGLIAAAAAVLLLAVILPLWNPIFHQTASPGNAVANADKQVVAPPQKLVEQLIPVPESLPRAPASPVTKRQPAKHKVELVPERMTHETVAAKAADEYLPLTYLAKTTAMDTGTIIRVRLSRSALVSLGLPVNLENSSDSVSAEVVMGDDGVARAIRLVQ
jgi:hypothetical protein